MDWAWEDVLFLVSTINLTLIWLLEDGQTNTVWGTGCEPKFSTSLHK